MNNLEKMNKMLLMCMLCFAEMMMVLIIMLCLSPFAGLLFGFIFVFLDFVGVAKWVFDTEKEEREREEMRKWHNEDYED